MKKIILFTALFAIQQSLFNCVFAQWTQLVSGITNSLEEIYFPVPDTGYAVGENGTIVKTTDGNSWTTLSIGATANLHDVFFLDSQNGFVVGDSALFAKTTDGGNTWAMQFLTNIGDISLGSVYFIDANTGFAGGRESVVSGIIFKTVDGGLNWTVTNTPTSIFDIYYVRIIFPDALTGYALSRGMCMKSIDGGNNWFVTDTALVASGGMFSILEDGYFFSADTGYIVGWYNPFTGYTDNGGTNWNDNYLGQWYSIDFPSRQTGYIVGWGQLVKTSDGGLSWDTITTTEIANNYLYSMDFTDDNTGYACGNGGVIIKTTSGGVTTVDELENFSAIKVFPNPSNGNFKIEIKSGKTSNSKIKLINTIGEVIYAENNLLKEGTNKINFNKENLPTGVYFLHIVSEEKNFMIKVIIE